MVDVSDNFNRAGPGLGFNWTTSTSWSAPAISASTVVIAATTGAEYGAYWNADSFQADQFGQMTIVNNVAGDNGGGPLVRHAAGATTCYSIYCLTADSITYLEWTNGSSAALGAVVSVTINAGSVLKLAVVGSTLTASVGGVAQATRTDGSITTGSPGFHTFANDSANAFDDWSGGPLSATAHVGESRLDGASTLSESAMALSPLQPDADSIDGTWTDQADGTSLFAAIDEMSVDDADYIKSAANPANDICKISLGNPTTTPAEPFIVMYRYEKTGVEQMDLGVRLLQGTTEIAVWSHSDISTSFVTVEQTLSGGQFAAIGDFNNLFIEFTADQVIPLGDLGLEGDFSGDLTLEGDFSGSFTLEGS